jgi:GNAT superfamily N-acetyltransferase
LTEPEIRPWLPEDAEATMPLFRELWAEEVVTPQGLVHWIAKQPERAAMQAWVAEADGEIAGFGNSRLRWALQAQGIAGVWSGVLPVYRRRGLGMRLFETAAAHIVGHGARRLESTVRDDDPDARAFARRLGFEEGRSEQYWELEVGSAAITKAEPAGEVSVVRLREVRDRERELFELYDSAERDMPDDYTHAMAFEDWLPETLGNPELDFELSAVVLVRDRPAAFAWLTADREGARAANEMTGTAPSFRRRGLARLAKEATIGWAAKAGIRTIVTSNDTTNADMLALNEHLGYRPSVLRISVTKEV